MYILDRLDDAYREAELTAPFLPHVPHHITLEKSRKARERHENSCPPLWEGGTVSILSTEGIPTPGATVGIAFPGAAPSRIDAHQEYGEHIKVRYLAYGFQPRKNQQLFARVHTVFEVLLSTTVIIFAARVFPQRNERLWFYCCLAWNLWSLWCSVSVYSYHGAFPLLSDATCCLC